MWTYADGARTVRAFWSPEGAGRAGSWVLADQATGNVQGVVPAGEFSRRFRPVDVFADVTGFPTYLGTVTAPDGSALVDLVLDRNPFMLANGPRRVARPHVLTVPRRHRDGWSSATLAELSACQAAMTLVAAWYRSLDGGHAVFCANDSPPNVDYQRDVEAAAGNPAAREVGAATARNPRQEVQHAHLHAFYAEGSPTENHESSALLGHAVVAQGRRVQRCPRRRRGEDRRRQPGDRRRHPRGRTALGRQLLLVPAGRGRPFLGDGRPGNFPGRVQPSRRPRRRTPGRARPQARRGRQPGPAQPGRRRAAPCRATGHVAAAVQLRDVCGPARTQGEVAALLVRQSSAQAVSGGADWAYC